MSHLLRPLALVHVLRHQRPHDVAPQPVHLFLIAWLGVDYQVEPLAAAWGSSTTESERRPLLVLRGQGTRAILSALTTKSYSLARAGGPTRATRHRRSPRFAAPPRPAACEAARGRCPVRADRSRHQKLLRRPLLSSGGPRSCLRLISYLAPVGVHGRNRRSARFWASSSESSMHLPVDCAERMARRIDPPQRQTSTEQSSSLKVSALANIVAMSPNRHRCRRDSSAALVLLGVIRHGGLFKESVILHSQ